MDKDSNKLTRIALTDADQQRRKARQMMAQDAANYAEKVRPLRDGLEK